MSEDATFDHLQKPATVLFLFNLQMYLAYEPCYSGMKKYQPNTLNSFKRMTLRD